MSARAKRGDLGGALVDLTQAIDKKPRYAEAFFNRGNVRWEKGDLEGAIADYTQALRFGLPLLLLGNRQLEVALQDARDGAWVVVEDTLGLGVLRALAADLRIDPQHEEAEPRSQGIGSAHGLIA